MTQGINPGTRTGQIGGAYVGSGAAEGATQTQQAEVNLGVADFLLPDDLPVADTPSESAQKIPTTEQINMAFNAINWDKPNMVDVLKLLHMVAASLKAAQNENKWAETNAQVQSLFNEASKMKDAAVAQFATTLATSVASIGLAGASLGNSVSQLRQLNSLTGPWASKFTDANANFSSATQAEITRIQAIGQRNQAIIQIGDGVLKGAGSGGQFAAEMYNARGKEDAAEAQLRSANADSSKQAEQTADEFCRKAREFIEQVLQARNSTEQAINAKM